MMRIAQEHGVEMNDMLGPRRWKKFLDARQEAMCTVYLDFPHLSLTQIGKMFRRDHTTVLNALEKFEVRLGGRERLQKALMARNTPAVAAE
jgi:chromosomal replication initiation ATPase DnaA